MPSNGSWKPTFSIFNLTCFGNEHVETIRDATSSVCNWADNMKNAFKVTGAFWEYVLWLLNLYNFFKLFQGATVARQNHVGWQEGSLTHQHSLAVVAVWCEYLHKFRIHLNDTERCKIRITYLWWKGDVRNWKKEYRHSLLLFPASYIYYCKFFMLFVSLHGLYWFAELVWKC